MSGRTRSQRSSSGLTRAGGGASNMAGTSADDAAVVEEEARPHHSVLRNALVAHEGSMLLIVACGPSQCRACDQLDSPDAQLRTYKTDDLLDAWAQHGRRPHACPLPPVRRARSPASLPLPRPPRAAWPLSASAAVAIGDSCGSLIRFGADPPPPCGCIGTCRLGSHAGRTARGSVVGEIDNVPSASPRASPRASHRRCVRPHGTPPDGLR